MNVFCFLLNSNELFSCPGSIPRPRAVSMHRPSQAADPPASPGAVADPDEVEQRHTYEALI